MKDSRELSAVTMEEKLTYRNTLTGQEITVTRPVTVQAREARMRRLANKYGLRLHKSRRDIDKGMYALIDAYGNFVAFGYNSNLGWCEATLDDIEEFL